MCLRAQALDDDDDDDDEDADDNGDDDDGDGDGNGDEEQGSPRCHTPGPALYQNFDEKEHYSETLARAALSRISIT